MPQYLGFVALGSNLTGALVTLASTGVPTNADALPTLRTYGPSGNVTGGNVTAAALDQANVTGLYSFTITASGANGFSTGQTYTIAVKYQISGQNRSDTLTFTVV